MRTNQSNIIGRPYLSHNTVWARLISELSFLDGKWSWSHFITALLTARQPFWMSESPFPFAVSQKIDGIILVSCVQAWYYFTLQNDRWPLKALVDINVKICFSLELIILHRSWVWCLPTQYIKVSSHTVVNHPDFIALCLFDDSSQFTHIPSRTGAMRLFLASSFRTRWCLCLQYSLVDLWIQNTLSWGHI